MSARPSRPSRWRARGSSQAASDSGVVETPAMTFCRAVSDDRRLRFWNRKRTRLRRTSSSAPFSPTMIGAEQPELALGGLAHGAEDGEQGRLARARRAGDDHQLAFADLHVDVEQHVDALRPLTVVMVDVDRLDDRRSEAMWIVWRCRHGHSNSMIGSTFHRRRIANRLDTTVMTTQATSATTHFTQAHRHTEMHRRLGRAVDEPSEREGDQKGRRDDRSADLADHEEEEPPVVAQALQDGVFRQIEADDLILGVVDEHHADHHAHHETQIRDVADRRFARPIVPLARLQFAMVITSPRPASARLSSVANSDRIGALCEANADEGRPVRPPGAEHLCHGVLRTS